MVNEFNQRFWFTLVDQMMALCDRRSSENRPHGVGGKTWRDLAPHFVFNLDEACCMANAGSMTVRLFLLLCGGVYLLLVRCQVVGCRTLNRHERIGDDSRVSITSVDCGNAAGDEAPSMFLMTGQQIPPHLKETFGSSKYLHEKGAPPGSFVCMTPTAFMTNEAWDYVTPRLITGIRDLPVVRDHPEWYVLLFFDGFKSHMLTTAAQQAFANARILTLKENAKSSHVNQAFDKDVAKLLKAGVRRWLHAAPEVTTAPSKIYDQWDVLSVVLTSHVGGWGHAWTSSFKRVNLHPNFRRPIEVWLSEIAAAIRAGEAVGMQTLDPNGPEYLRLIEVPTMYKDLPDVDQAELLELLRSPNFGWDKQSILDLPAKFVGLLEREGELSRICQGTRAQQ